MGRKSFTTGVEDAEPEVTPAGNESNNDLPASTLAEQAAGRDALARVYANRVMPTEEFEAPKE